MAYIFGKILKKFSLQINAAIILEADMGQWRQFHADGHNQGFVPVSTQAAQRAKWSLQVGPVGYGSPVVGPDNTIYIGTLKGELVAVDPNGTLKWRLSLSGNHHEMITASPAVGRDGNVYVVSTINAIVRDHRSGKSIERRLRKSKLHCVGPSGNLLWSFSFPENPSPSGIGGYTLSSPKVTGEQNPFVFIPSLTESAQFGRELLVIQSGNLVFRTDVSSYPPPPIVGEGPGLGDILNAIWDFISSPVDFDNSGVGQTLEQIFGYPEPTVAVIDEGSFASGPLVIVVDNYKTLKAFRWQFPILVPLWTKVSEANLRSTPAVFVNGLVAIGQYNGTVSFYDLESGEQMWKPWYKANHPVLSPPASFGRQVYFTADKKIIVLDANSKLWKQHDLGGRSLGAVALSASFAYVSANDGFYSFSFDLQNFSKNTDVVGGVSSPAIGDDGTVYVMDMNSTLWAFGGPLAGNLRDHRFKKE
jgi:outer membrane protein assembly factor BamB